MVGIGTNMKVDYISRQQLELFSGLQVVGKSNLRRHALFAINKVRRMSIEFVLNTLRDTPRRVTIAERKISVDAIEGVPVPSTDDLIGCSRVFPVVGDRGRRLVPPIGW